MKNLSLILLILLSSSSLSFAEDIIKPGESVKAPIKIISPPAPRDSTENNTAVSDTNVQQQEIPCSHNPKTQLVSGVNMDEVKCLLQITDQSIFEKETQITKLKAALTMSNNDLVIVKKSLADVQKKLDDLNKK